MKHVNRHGPCKEPHKRIDDELIQLELFFFFNVMSLFHELFNTDFDQ
jgi:hypothetical protein